MRPVRIERCVCSDRTFAELRAIAGAADARTIDELQRRVEFGRGCGLCRPYVRRMLRTGEVVFGELVTDEGDGDG